MPSDSSSFSGPLRVIVADDSATFLFALVAVLEHSNVATVVATASRGEEAIGAFGRCEPDLVIADVGMPGMNGLELAAALRRLSSRVRIMLVSANDGLQLEHECLQHGADSFVPKLAIYLRLWPEIERLFPMYRVTASLRDRTAGSDCAQR